MKPRSKKKSPLVTSIFLSSIGLWAVLAEDVAEPPSQSNIEKSGDQTPDSSLPAHPSSLKEDSVTTGVPDTVPTAAASDSGVDEGSVSEEDLLVLPTPVALPVSDDLIPDALLPVIPMPDGMDLATSDPLSGGADYDSAGAVVPYSLPMSGGITAGGLEGGGQEASEVLEDDISYTMDENDLQWVSAPGGQSALPIASSGAGFAPAPPSGFTAAVPGYPIGGPSSMGGILDGFSLAANFSSIYNSNVTNSSGGSGRPIQDDFIFALGGTLSYMSKAEDWTFGGSYSGSYNQYLEQTDYSGYNQSMSLVGNFNGPKLTASVTCGIGYTQGNNRYYSSNYVEQVNMDLGLNLRYRLSPKTSLQGNLGQSLNLTGQNSYNDTESFNMGLAALWKYSKLTELGPGIRYTYDSGGRRDARTSIGPELLLNYKLAAKVRLNSRIGLEFPHYEDAGSADPTVAGSIGLNYKASNLWGMNLSLYSGTQAYGSGADVFTQVNSLRVGYNRKVHRATLNLGVSYEIDTYDVVGTAQERPDQNYFNIDSSFGMPLFSNTTFGSIFIQYNDQSGSASQTWDAIQTGFSLSRSF